MTEASIPTYPKARQPHTCDECHRTIRPRERYERIAHFEGGTASTSKFCVHCVVLWQVALQVEGVHDALDFHLDEWLVSIRQMAAYTPIDSDEGRTVHEFAAVAVQRGRRWSSIYDPSRLVPIPRALWHEDSYGFGWIYGVQPGGPSEPLPDWFDARYWSDRSRGRTIDLSIDTPDTLPPIQGTKPIRETTAGSNLKETR